MEIGKSGRIRARAIALFFCGAEYEALSAAAKLRHSKRTTKEGGIKPPLHGSEEFGWLDAAGGELRDKLAVGGEEIVSGQFAGQDPGGLLKGVGGGVHLGDLSGEEVDFEFFGKRRVVVAHTGNFHGFGEADAEFFAQLAGKGLFEGFTGADFAAGKFPLEGRGVATAALADEDAAIGTFNNGCDDLEH